MNDFLYFLLFIFLLILIIVKDHLLNSVLKTIQCHLRTGTGCEGPQIGIPKDRGYLLQSLEQKVLLIDIGYFHTEGAQ